MLGLLAPRSFDPGASPVIGCGFLALPSTLNPKSIQDDISNYRYKPISICR